MPVVSPLLLAIVACAVTALLAGVAPGAAPHPSSAPRSASDEKTPVYAGLAGSLVDVCARRTPIGPDRSVTLVTAQSWTWAASGEGVRASAWQPRAAVILGTGTPSSGADQSARAVGRCMNRTPLDWSIALSESTEIRRLLYSYYRAELIPCLKRSTVARPRLPSRSSFLEAGLQGFDPYRSVRVESVAAARQLQATCPPAPRSVILAAAMVAAARSAPR